MDKEGVELLCDFLLVGECEGSFKRDPMILSL